MDTTVDEVVDGAFVVYSHIGVSSASRAVGTADGALTLRDDLRGPDGVLVAPLIVMVLDSVATATLPLASAIPTRVGVELFAPATDVAELRLTGRVRRRGRTQIYYEARIEDAAQPGRLVGFGTVNMAVTGPPVAEYVGHQSTPRPAERFDRPLLEVFEGQRRPDGSYEIAELSSRTGFGRVHAGIMTVAAEAAATDAVHALTGGRPARTTSLEAQLLTGGRVGPFAVRPEVLAIDAGQVTVRVEVVDRGEESRLVSVITSRLRFADGPAANPTAGQEG